MLGFHFIEMAVQVHRERERVLMREVEIARLLRDQRRPAAPARRFVRRVGEQLVLVGCWLQGYATRAGESEGAV